MSSLQTMTNNINTPTTSNSCSLFNVVSLDREDEDKDFSVYDNDNDDEYVSFEDFLKSVEGLESLESKERERQCIKNEEDEREYHQLRLESRERFEREQQRLRNEELAPIMIKFYNNAIENAVRMEQTGPTSEQIDSELIECHSIIPFLDNPYRIETYKEHMALLEFHRSFHDYSKQKQQRLKEEHMFLMYYYNDD